ncbi:MAG: PIF1 family DEAD/DEAH box helicase [bacterium]
MTQDFALKALGLGYNIFLTGAAGSGKTYVLNKFIASLKSKNIGVAVTASTGIAATHMNGITVHSWSGIGISEKLSEAEIKYIISNGKIRKRIKATKVLIIDEISMLHAHQLDLVDVICRRILSKSLPFGGLQIVLCGDFFQLPPVHKKADAKVEFVHAAYSWKAANIRVCYLDEQHRQKNDILALILNDLRSGTINIDNKNLLEARIGFGFAENIKPTRLYSHNFNVDNINQQEIAKLSGSSRHFEMHSSGDEYLIKTLINSCLAPEKLELKIGAQVMFVKNNFEVGYVNGTTGIVTSFDEDTLMPNVTTSTGRVFAAEPEVWMIGEDDQVLASVRQVPLRLAWAITIHKSQGMSLDGAEIDLSRAFEFGMGYVALSRLRSLEGLRLVGLNELALQVDPDVLVMDLAFRKFSQDFEKTISNNCPPGKTRQASIF